MNAYWVTVAVAGSTWSSSSSSSGNLSPANDNGVLSTPGGWYAGAAAPASAFPPPGSTRPLGRSSLSRNHVLPWVWFEIVGAVSLASTSAVRAFSSPRPIASVRPDERQLDIAFFVNRALKVGTNDRIVRADRSERARERQS
jgi:hypothetical protein